MFGQEKGLENIALLLLVLVTNLIVLVGCTDSTSFKASSSSQYGNNNNGSDIPPVGPEILAQDNTPPVVRLVSPLDNIDVSGLVNLEVAATDDIGIANIQYQWDGENLGEPVNVAPFTYSWDTTQFSDGSYTLRAIATDWAGHTATSNFHTVVVRNSNVIIDNPLAVPADCGVEGVVINVPADQPTIQAAIDAASNGDTIILAPGIYSGGNVIAGKCITLTSNYILSKDEADINNTIVSGGAPGIAIYMSANGSKIANLRFENGDHAIDILGDRDLLDSYVQNRIFVTVENNRIYESQDAVSVEGANGYIIGNHIIDSGDDAIDCDYCGEVYIEKNRIVRASEDGIEIRNQGHDGNETLNIYVRANMILYSGASKDQGDGVQFIDYDNQDNKRYIHIHSNVIAGSKSCAIGYMANTETTQDFGAPVIEERVTIFNNTLDNQVIGVCGGGNTVMVNNIISNNSMLGVKNMTGGAAAAYNLFYNNGADYQNSTIDINTTLVGQDPRFVSTISQQMENASYQLQNGSPAIDAGVGSFTYLNQLVLNIPANQFNGVAPDLGAFEK